MLFSSDRFGTSTVPLYLTPAFDFPGNTKTEQMAAETQSLNADHHIVTVISILRSICGGNKQVMKLVSCLFPQQ